VCTDPDTDHEIPNHIIISKSEDHLIIQDSDSSPKSQLLFSVSDSESSDPMDVVRSDEESAQPQKAESDTDGNNDLDSDSSIPDHIILPNDLSGSDNTRFSMGGLEVMAVFRHDPGSGRFTPASFTHCPDTLVD